MGLQLLQVNTMGACSCTSLPPNEEEIHIKSLATARTLAVDTDNTSKIHDILREENANLEEKIDMSCDALWVKALKFEWVKIQLSAVKYMCDKKLFSTTCACESLLYCEDDMFERGCGVRVMFDASVMLKMRQENEKLWIN